MFVNKHFASLQVYGYITREFFGLRILNFQGVSFILTQTYKEIFKSALVYLCSHFIIKIFLIENNFFMINNIFNDKIDLRRYDTIKTYQ